MLDVHIQMMNEVVEIIRKSKVINVPVSDVDPNKTRKISRDGKEIQVPYIDFGPVKIFPYQNAGHSGKGKEVNWGYRAEITRKISDNKGGFIEKIGWIGNFYIPHHAIKDSIAAIFEYEDEV